MSVQGTKSEEKAATGTYAPGPQEAPIPQAPGYDSNNGDVFNLFNAIGATQNLGAQIEDYIKELRTRFEVADIVRDFGKIEIVRLNEPNGAHLVTLDDRSIILLFSEMLNADLQNFSPLSDQAVWAAQSMQQSSALQKYKIVNTQVIQPCDYVRVDQMARYLRMTLVAGKSEFRNVQARTINSCAYVVDPDVNVARRFIERINPSAVMPRTDIGFTVLARRPRRQSVQGPRGPQNNSELFELAAVGGYVEILTAQDPVSRQHKYLPMIHITSIASDLQLPFVIPMCLAIAADQLLASGRWLQPFMSFQKGRPNLGQLFPDTKDPSKLWFTSKPSDIEELRQRHFMPPMLALDVTDGLARNPNLEAYGYAPHADRVYDHIQDFFGSTVSLNRGVAPYDLRGMDFVGVYGDQKGTLVDSRCMDYLSLVAEGASDMETNSLLQYFRDPQVRARVVSNKTAGSFKSLYRNNVAVLSPILLSTLAAAVQQNMLIEAPQGQNQQMPTDWMPQQAVLYAQQNFTTTRTDNRGGVGMGSFYSV